MTDDRKHINCAPTKSYFIKTLVRDIHLIDAVLDLIDNSIDSYIKNEFTDRREISIEISRDSFKIKDNCGGINKEKIYDHVFRFGEPTSDEARTIGVFGIGLKRSIFKIGTNILIETDDGIDNVSIKIDKAWIEDEDRWELDFEKEDTTQGDTFTAITIKELIPDIATELGDVIFENALIKRIKDTYSFFIEEKLTIKVNGTSIEHFDFKFLYNDDFVPYHKTLVIDDNVSAELFAGFTPIEKYGDLYGWYVFCNDRLVVRNDTTAKTGWGGLESRKYHYPEDNRFLGLVFLRSDKPLSLPWHTTKEDIQVDSAVYRTVQVEMRSLTTTLIDVIRFAGKTPDPETGETIGKALFDGVDTKYRKEITEDTDVKVPIIAGNIRVNSIPKTTSIQYTVDKKELIKVKERLGGRYMSNKDAGRKTFNYYKKMEEIIDE